MASVLESKAAFRQKAFGHGLGDAEIGHLIGQGLDTYSKLAFALTTPGGEFPDESGLLQLLDATLRPNG